MVGQEIVPTGRLFFAVARLLEMRVRRRKEGEQVLMRPQPPLHPSLAEVYPAILQSLPSAVRNYLHLKDKKDRPTATYTVPPRTPQEIDLMMQQQELEEKQRQEIQNRANSLISAASVRAGLGMKNALLNQTEKPFGELDVRTQGLYALQWLSDRLLSMMDNMPVKVPDYVQHFSDARLKGGWHGTGDKRKFTVDVIVTRPDGTFNGAGITSEGTKRL